LEVGFGKNALIKNVFAFKNIVPNLLAILSSHLNRMGFLKKINTIVKIIKNTPYVNALTMNNNADPKMNRGHDIGESKKDING